VWGQCGGCGHQAVVAAKVRQDPPSAEPGALKRVDCACGQRGLALLMVERWDDGFYDEGVLGGACVACGACQAVVDLD